METQGSAPAIGRAPVLDPNARGNVSPRAIRTSRRALLASLTTSVYGLLGFFVSLPCWTGVVMLGSVTGMTLALAAGSRLPQGSPAPFLRRRGRVLLSLVLGLWPWGIFCGGLRYRGGP